jgi:hypothetical protein
LRTLTYYPYVHLRQYDPAIVPDDPLGLVRTLHTYRRSHGQVVPG